VFSNTPARETQVPFAGGLEWSKVKDYAAGIHLIYKRCKLLKYQRTPLFSMDYPGWKETISYWYIQPK